MKTKRKFVNAFPKSSSAKNYFDHRMNSLHGMEVVEETVDQFYLVSINKRCGFWCGKTGNDHWKITK